ncbi:MULTISPECIES: ABC transporter substrate-binding protein [unclassified Chelatococcus]|uniref:ABC transporter substrate-binding protein n=1 Tax=unclassified Chelatococcus TaxID=2638111 RepID=UPI001BCD7492|nr:MULTISPECIES: ABC transporter substrate-binding protein [unclassified Chelatococcus]CAH1661384.1 Amino acid/amide ABC transporter substrate-binding protein (HAAT family) [Hyphomicrobiales bacterium]MBS7741247.1 ABC transporter substrate-binding protein [Chelatococcus sp. HY11]MBX3546271.1 ABC transporter substrate-binding protein [Chelatococcus sp.]MCO5078070.1 ABC transporter substrate-binding protein [Chelatococcus sp.]CAH1683118.1 Amino acid/amide ABC transporter substrate-binding protei
MINRRTLLTAVAGTGALMAAPSVLRAQGAGSGPIRIGALNPVTGSGSPYGSGMQKMILAAAEAVNAAGGAAGRPIEITAEDTQTNPQAGVLAAKKLIEANKVQAILGTWSSGVSLAVIPLCNDAGIPLFHCSGAPALSTPPANAKGLGFRFQATNGRFGRAFAEICVKEGFKRPATMAFNNASGIGNTEGFRQAWEAKGGKVVESVVYEPNQASYRSELMKVLAAQPDVIVTGSYLADTTILLREWFQSGQPVRWIIPGWAANPDLIKALGPEVTEDIISVDSVSNEGSPAYAQFDAAYQKAMNQPGSANVYAAMTWDMVNVLALAIEAAGSSDMSAVVPKLREVGNPPGTVVSSFAEGKAALKNGKINYDGASSVLDFDQYGDVTPDFGAYFITGGKLERRYIVKI